ncbi:OmpA family protein [Vibrio salinus]|uniref:OmpA family protein n=1 Tax=Vibrio salinus TaxID=2899784 RepID=UPI001E2BC9F3|nr:OmpA family protein [Vibrio salinus]MCE0495590.1 OmpA family protein [Vibrio salinus]
MKYFVYVLMLTLSGCGTMDMVKDRYFNQNLLDTAPKDRMDVKYPDWGEAPKMQYVSPSETTTNKASTHRSSVSATQNHEKTLDSLTRFLKGQRIEYDILPGNFSIVRVKRGVPFEAGSDDVSYESRAWLYKLSDYLSKVKSHNIEVVIDGHADKTGGQKLNDKLSRDRANSVRALLADAPNISVDSIYARGYADALPACSNVSQYGRSCNRRVDIFFIVGS